MTSPASTRPYSRHSHPNPCYRQAMTPFIPNRVQRAKWPNGRKNISVGHNTDNIQPRCQELSQNPPFMIEKSLPSIDYQLSITCQLVQITCPVRAIAALRTSVLGIRKFSRTKNISVSDNNFREKPPIPLSALSNSSLVMPNSETRVIVGVTCLFARNPVYLSVHPIITTVFDILRCLACTTCYDII